MQINLENFENFENFYSIFYFTFDCFRNSKIIYVRCYMTVEADTVCAEDGFVLEDFVFCSGFIDKQTVSQ